MSSSPVSSTSISLPPALINFSPPTQSPIVQNNAQVTSSSSPPLISTAIPTTMPITNTPTFPPSILPSYSPTNSSMPSLQPSALPTSQPSNTNLIKISQGYATQLFVNELIELNDIEQEIFEGIIKLHTSVIGYEVGKPFIITESTILSQDLGDTCRRRRKRPSSGGKKKQSVFDRFRALFGIKQENIDRYDGQPRRIGHVHSRHLQNNSTTANNNTTDVTAEDTASSPPPTSPPQELKQRLLTFVDDDESKDVVVSVFAEGYTKEGEGDVDVGVLTHGYKLDQSSSQKKVLALESLMNGQDSVEFDHCSMFIDDWLYCDTFDCANDAPCLGFNCAIGLIFCC